MVEEQKAKATKAIESIRSNFARQEWNEVVETYDSVKGELAGVRAARLEASCLAARAWVALKDRAKARSILQPVAKAAYKKPVHYEFLARALIDLKQYQQAAEACTKADSLRTAELAAASSSTGSSSAAS